MWREALTAVEWRSFKHLGMRIPCRPMDSSNQDFHCFWWWPGRGTSQPVASTQACWMRILALTTYGARKPSGSKMVAVFFSTFRLVSSVSGVNEYLKENVSRSAVHSTPKVLVVDSLFSSKSMVCARSSAGMSFKTSAWLDIHFLRWNPAKFPSSVSCFLVSFAISIVATEGIRSSM